jgi:pectinesterase
VPSIPKGRQDNTHYNIYGAHLVANALADEIARKVPDLKRHVRHYDFVVSHEGRGNYMDLQQAVDDAPKGQPVKILVLGGKWQRPKVVEGKNIHYIKAFGAVIR